MIVPATGALLEAAARRFGGQASGAATFAGTAGTLAFAATKGATEDATKGAGDVEGWCWGYLLPRPDGSSMLYLHHLEVAEHCRRRGVGRALLAAFRDAGVRLGATRMFLTTGERNTAARRLYESMGAGLAEQGPTVNYWFLLTS